jgi:hypothetical protein
MKMKMYTILDKAKPHTENIKSLNFIIIIIIIINSLLTIRIT